jgi:endo-1,4-beta-xylanase
VIQLKKYNFILCVLLLTGLIYPVLSCDFNFKGKGDEEPPPAHTWDTTWPLQNIYRNYFLLGNIISPNDLGTIRFDILTRHYNTVTAENQMKPDFIAPSNQPTSSNWAYRFTDADRVVNGAITAGMKVVGHTLVWHSQTPGWLTNGNKDTVLNNLEKYVTDVAGHFKGRILDWDVVNEAMRDGLNSSLANGDWRNCLRLNDNPNQPGSGSRWNAVIGPEYIEKAFLAARAADPNAKLYYNDYNLNNEHKARAVYNMVRDINTRYSNVGGRQLIDGIGMQSHHHINTNPQTVRASIDLFASLGVEIAITELDIIAAGRLLSQVNPPIWNQEAARRQAEQYAAMFRIFKEKHANISRVTFWGIDDGTHWRTLDGSGGHATLLDRDYNLKPAFYAVANP